MTNLSLNLSLGVGRFETMFRLIEQVTPSP